MSVLGRLLDMLKSSDKEMRELGLVLLEECRNIRVLKEVKGMCYKYRIVHPSVTSRAYIICCDRINTIIRENLARKKGNKKLTKKFKSKYHDA